MFKKIMAVALLLVTTLCLTACPGITGSASVEEIIEKSAEAMRDVSSYQFDMNMSVDITAEDESGEYSVNMSADISGALDLENQEMMMDMAVEAAMLGMSVEFSGKTYIVDDVIYTMVGYDESDSTWAKEEVPEGYWGEVDQMELQADILKAVNAEVVGSETVSGVECYILELSPDIEQLWQLLMQQSNLTGEEMMPEIDVELYQDIFKEFYLKQWVAKDTYYIMKAEMAMAIEATAEEMGYPEEEGSMTADFYADMLAYDYNQPVSIVLPAEAEQATGEYDEPQGIVDEANDEVIDVNVAVLAAMIDNEVYELTAGGTVGPGYASSVYAADGVTELDIVPYLDSSLEATYTLDESGWVIAAVAEPGGRWDGLTYTEEDGWVE